MIFSFFCTFTDTPRCPFPAVRALSATKSPQRCSPLKRYEKSESLSVRSAASLLRYFWPSAIFYLARATPLLAWHDQHIRLRLCGCGHRCNSIFADGIPETTSLRPITCLRAPASVFLAHALTAVQCFPAVKVRLYCGVCSVRSSKQALDVDSSEKHQAF